MHTPSTISLSLATALLLATSTIVNAVPVARPGFGGNLPGRGRNSLLPGGIAGAFVEAFKTTNLGNSEFTCSRNGLPCGATDEDSDEEEVDDGITRTSTGGLNRNEYTDAAGVEHAVISGEIYNNESSQYSEAAFSDDVEFDDDSDEEEAAAIEEFQAADRSHTCTRNGIPCGQFEEGSQKELKIERTASCTRNGIPCGDYVEGQDEEESFTINKSNDSQKTCTRNGIPCEEYERLKANGEIPESDNDYQVRSGGNAPPAVLDETVQKGKGKVGYRPINVNN